MAPISRPNPVTSSAIVQINKLKNIAKKNTPKGVLPGLFSANSVYRSTIDNQKKIRDCRRFLEVGVDKKTERCDPNG